MNLPLVQTAVDQRENLCSSSLKLSFEKINYSIPTSCTSKKKKTILNDVSGLFSPGMNAILGPTGCGKSTLLDILADRKDHRHVQGQICLSGQRRPSNYREMIGYVMQDDTINERLTVRENLLFSAHLRLSRRGIGKMERIERVEQILKDLDLQMCSSTIIGTDFIRGISNGEKKRTSIGMELIHFPSIIFLDEPTTGLDASTAQNLMNFLAKLSRQGRIIVFSIHQARYSIYKLFDKILFLSNGSTIYFGRSAEILNYFSSLGFHCEQMNNPADFLLDLLIDSDVHLQTIYRQSSIYSNLSDELAENRLEFSSTIDDEKISSWKNFFLEFFFVSRRTFSNVMRNPSLFISQMLSVIIYGLFTGVIFHRLEKTIEPGIHNRFGAIFFIISCQVLTSMSALETLIKERSLFIHDTLRGYYGVSSFFFSKLFIDVPFVHLFPSFIYAFITFFLIDFQRSIKHFAIFLLTNLISKLVGSAICYFVASSTSTFGVGLVMVVCGYVLMMLFSGFLIDLESIHRIIRWIRWLSVFRYSSNVLAINEFRNLTLCLTPDLTICLMKGEEILRNRHINFEKSFDLYSNLFALGLLAIIFFLLTFIQLFRIPKFK